jgi:predicted acylesterase/phospholipase RssA
MSLQRERDGACRVGPTEADEAPLEPHRYTSLHRLATDPGHRLVLALGGGSVPGICGNVALVRLLEELDLREHVAEIWGTSAGAVVGGGWASGAPALRILDLTKGLDRRGVMDYCYLKIAKALLLRPFGARLPDGLIHGRHLAATIEAGLRVQTFEECPIPFRCIACTDDGRGRRHVFRRGPLLPAILSSLSLAGFIMPRKQEGEECGYYDGGLVEKTPLISPINEHVRLGETRKLILLGTHFASEQHRPATGFFDRYLQALEVQENLNWEYQAAAARQHPGTVLMMLKPRFESAQHFNFGRADEYYVAARRCFRDLLQNAKLALTFGLT